MRRLLFIAGLLALLVSTARAQTPTISVLDLGAATFAQKTTAKLRERLASTDEFNVADADLTRAAAKGLGYSGSLNLSVSEARSRRCAGWRLLHHRRRANSSSFIIRAAGVL